MSSSNSLYERDYYTWALEQERALQERRVEDLEAHLAGPPGEVRAAVAPLLHVAAPLEQQPGRRVIADGGALHPVPGPGV